MRADENNKYIRNQCSLIIRVEDDELEIPVTFGMTPDEIRALYPFLLPILNQKIENPAVQFSREEKRGSFADLNKEEYTARLAAVMQQSKFWYDKPEAGLLDIAVRFACDLKLKGISELSSIFGFEQSEAIAIKPVSQEEALVIMRQLHLTDEESAVGPDDAADFVDDEAKRVRPSMRSGLNVDSLVERFGGKSPVADIAAIAKKDLESVDASKYVSSYKSSEFSDDDIENGVLKSNLSGNAEAEDLTGEPVVEDRDEEYENEQQKYDEGEFNYDDFDEESFVDDDGENY